MDSTSASMPNGRTWLTRDGHLTLPISFSGSGQPAKVRKGVVEFLAMAHLWGGACGVTGSMRHAGIRACSLGLATLVAAEHVNGRKVSHYRLTVDADGLVRDLAERCASVALAKGSVIVLPGDVGARVPSLKVAARWKDVPLVVPGPGWPAGARACPGCFCSPDAPCEVVLDDGCGTAVCCPAGLFDLKKCSVCMEAA